MALHATRAGKDKVGSCSGSDRGTRTLARRPPSVKVRSSVLRNTALAFLFWLMTSSRNSPELPMTSNSPFQESWGFSSTIQGCFATDPAPPRDSSSKAPAGKSISRVSSEVVATTSAWRPAAARSPESGRKTLVAPISRAPAFGPRKLLVLYWLGRTRIWKGAFT